MIADSSAWIEYIRGTGSPAHRRRREALDGSDPVWMLDVVYQEVLQGAPNRAAFLRLRSFLDEVGTWRPEDPRALAGEAALLYARCRWRGITVRSPNDCLIAVCAIEAGEALLHADRDFDLIATVEPRLQAA